MEEKMNFEGNLLSRKYLIS